MSNKYKCDNCKEVFNEEDIVLQPLIGNIEIIGQSIMVKNIITGKPAMTNTKNAVEGDCTVHCPKCFKIHFWGFDMVREENELSAQG